MKLFCKHNICIVHINIDTDKFYLVKCLDCGKIIKVKKNPGDKFPVGTVIHR